MIKSFFFLTAFYFFISNFTFSQSIEDKLLIFTTAIKDNDCKNIIRYSNVISNYTLSNSLTDYLGALYKITNCYYLEVKIDSSIFYLEKYIATKEKFDLTKDTTYINDLETLSFLNQENNDSTKRIEVLNKILENTRNKNDIFYLKKNLNTLELLFNFYYKQKNNFKVLEINLECLKLREKLVGKKHPDYFADLNLLIINYLSLGDYRKALENSLMCLDMEEKDLGKENSNYLMTLSVLAMIYNKLGDYPKALEINLECLKIKEKLLGKEHPDYLLTLGNLASNYSDLRDYKKSFKLNLECLIIREKVLGKEHPDYLLTLGHLASNYSELGDYKKSLELNLECLIIKEKVLGVEHFEYIISLENLSSNYSDLGDYKKSLEFNLKSLNTAKKTLGVEHPIYLTSLGNLALLHSKMGDYKKSLLINLECLKLREKVLGKESPDYINSLFNIAANFTNLNEFEESIEKSKECLKIAEKIFGKNNLYYEKILNNLSVNYSKIGDYKKSLELNLECLIIREKFSGKEHPDYLRSLNNLASNYIDLGDFKKALEINLKCLKIKEKVLGKEHPDYLLTLGNLAHNYSCLGNYSKALEINLECLKIKEKVLGKEHPDYLLTLSNLASNYSSLDNYTMAFELNFKCLKVREKVLGKEHLDYLISLNNLAHNYSCLGNYSKALEINLECLKIKEKIIGVENLDYLVTLGNLAHNYSCLGNYSKALELNFECLSIKNKLFGAKHPEFLFSLSNQILYFIRLGKYSKALELNLECLNYKEKVYGNEHPEYLSTMGDLALNYIYLGDFKKALELNLKCLKTIEYIKGKENQNYLILLSNTAYSFYYLNELKSVDSLLTIENQILFKYIANEIFGKDLKTQEIFKSNFNENNLVFTNYSIYRNKSNIQLSTLTFNSWLNLNGIISNQSSQLEPQIRASKDTSLIQLFEKWQLNKLQILKYYELTKPELEKRGINIIELEEEINEQERALSRGSEMFSEMKKTYVLSDIQQQLKEDEAYVDIVRLPYYNFNTKVWSDTIRYLAYIITKDTKEIPTTVLLENGNQLEGEIASYYAENTFGKSKREKDSISYAYFWKPIYKELSGKRKVYLSSGGVFNNINVQTLFNPSTNKYVSEELEVQLVNNGRTFIQQKTKKPQVYTKNTATFIGYPNFNGTLSEGSINEDAIFATAREFSPMLLDTLSRGANVSPLPGTQKEVETIGELLKTKKWDVNVFTENNASEEEIKKVESPRVLHIATHGYFLKQTDNLQKESGLRMLGMDTKRFVENPLLRSGLLLSGANKTLKGDTTKASENGILTAYEAAYLHLQGTELVVLSACETGKGELKNGEGVYGLRKSFADAGAKNIIMSLWKVDDKVTQEFMTSFYTNWNTGITIREAFNKTQQSIKALYPQPYYWGAFVLVGE